MSDVIITPAGDLYQISIVDDDGEIQRLALDTPAFNQLCERAWEAAADRTPRWRDNAYRAGFLDGFKTGQGQRTVGGDAEV